MPTSDKEPLTGLELREAVALRLMGWEIRNHGTVVYDPTRDTETSNIADEEVARLYIRAVAPHYQAGLPAAWEVVERMADQGWDMTIVSLANGQAAVWFHKGGVAGSAVKQACRLKRAALAMTKKGLPTAICQAALNAADGLARE